jgi:hypothetical protein
VHVLERSRLSSASGRARLLASTIAVGAGILLAGCSAIQERTPTPAATARPTEATPTPAETPTAKPALTFRPELPASENHDYFDRIAAAVHAADREAGGAAFIDALAEGGFDKSQMEVTFDRTAVDLEADSIQFSVRVHGECLIGQVGPDRDGYHSVVAPLLGSGTCLIGATRQIDW